LFINVYAQRPRTSSHWIEFSRAAAATISDDALENPFRTFSAGDSSPLTSHAFTLPSTKQPFPSKHYFLTNTSHLDAP
jgi:hypothetical protein